MLLVLLLLLLLIENHVAPRIGNLVDQVANRWVDLNHIWILNDSHATASCCCANLLTRGSFSLLLLHLILL